MKCVRSHVFCFLRADVFFCQGKEEFEKNQKQLLEKGNIIRHNKTQLEQQQVPVCTQLLPKSIFSWLCVLYVITIPEGYGYFD